MEIDKKDGEFKHNRSNTTTASTFPLLRSTAAAAEAGGMEGGDSGASRGLLTWEEFPPGHGSGPVTLVLHEGEASVFGFICSTRVDNDVHNAFGYLLHFC